MVPKNGCSDVGEAAGHLLIFAEYLSEIVGVFGEAHMLRQRNGEAVSGDLVMFHPVAVSDQQEVPDLRILRPGQAGIARNNQASNSLRNLTVRLFPMAVENSRNGLLMSDALAFVLQQQASQLRQGGVFGKFGQGENDLGFGAVKVPQLIEKKLSGFTQIHRS